MLLLMLYMQVNKALATAVEWLSKSASKIDAGTWNAAKH